MDAKRIIILMLLILGIVIAISPQIFWGFETMGGHDMFTYFIRAEALAHQNVDIYHCYPETR